MNNGHLLNNLLGITSANSASTKATATKARFETSEKFQQAFEQARPEVAARKPVARKDNTSNEVTSAARSVSKPAPQRHSSADASRAESQSKACADEADKTTSTAISATDTGKPVDADQQVTQPDETQDQYQNEQTGLDTLLIDPTLTIAAQSGELLASADDLINPDVGTVGLDDSVTEADTAALLAVDGSLLLPAAGQSPLTSSVIGESTNPLVGNLPSLTAASQATAGLVTSSASITGQSLAIQDDVAGDLSDGTMSTTSAEGELSGGDAGIGENPDFLLLNSKAAMNKLTETGMSAALQDAAVPATDVAKTATGAAVESLVRLTEAQSPAARAFVVQTGVPVTVGSPQWSQAVGDKVLWLAAQNVSAAEIRLDPPELGPMQVKVSINQDQASVTFTSPHPMVREALDQQLSRLREMFSEQGLNLVNVDVSDKSFAQQEREQKESAKNANTDLDEEDLTPVGLSQAVSMRLVDHYA